MSVRGWNLSWDFNDNEEGSHNGSETESFRVRSKSKLTEEKSITWRDMKTNWNSIWENEQRENQPNSTWKDSDYIQHINFPHIVASLPFVEQELLKASTGGGPSAGILELRFPKTNSLNQPKPSPFLYSRTLKVSTVQASPCQFDSG